jgi:predicted adenylyl cyclase CyaB
MLEKEIKILEIDIAQVTKKLEEFWAVKTFDGFIHDVYYDFPANPNLKMEEKDRLFRVRKKWETHLYTIKKKRKELRKSENVNAKDEHETEITDVESFSRVLEKYGMTKTREKKKHRISYRLHGIEFDIDQYEWIPPLLEIEANRREEIDVLIGKLGLEKNEQMIWGSRSLFNHYWIEYLNF